MEENQNNRLKRPWNDSSSGSINEQQFYNDNWVNQEGAIVEQEQDTPTTSHDAVNDSQNNAPKRPRKDSFSDSINEQQIEQYNIKEEMNEESVSSDSLISLGYLTFENEIIIPKGSAQNRDLHSDDDVTFDSDCEGLQIRELGHVRPIKIDQPEVYKQEALKNPAIGDINSSLQNKENEQFEVNVINSDTTAKDTNAADEFTESD